MISEIYSYGLEIKVPKESLIGLKEQENKE